MGFGSPPKLNNGLSPTDSPCGPAANSFLRFMGCQELAVKPVRIQKSPFRDERRELSRDEYIRLVQAARAEVSNKGKWRTVFLPGGPCRPRQPCRVKPAR